MEITDKDTDPNAEPAGANGERASDFYDADRPPFPELPEKPAKAPSMPGGGAAGAVPVDTGAPGSRQLQLRGGAGVVVAVLLLLLLRRRRNRRSARVGRRARQS